MLNTYQIFAILIIGATIAIVIATFNTYNIGDSTTKVDKKKQALSFQAPTVKTPSIPSTATTQVKEESQKK